MDGPIILAIILGVFIVIYLLVKFFEGDNRKNGALVVGGSKNQKLGVIGLIVMLFGILGLTNYVKNLDNLL
jgi:hypothetical protein